MELGKGKEKPEKNEGLRRNGAVLCQFTIEIGGKLEITDNRRRALSGSKSGLATIKELPF